MKMKEVHPVADIKLFPQIEDISSRILSPKDMTSHPFHISWYNELVGPKFHLEFHDSCVALVIISGPDVFEKCVLPHLNKTIKSSAEAVSTGESSTTTATTAAKENYFTNDPLDDSIKAAFAEYCQEINNFGFETVAYHDYDLHPNRRPKVLVQTAAHVAGVVQYFHPSLLDQSVAAEHFVPLAPESQQDISTPKKLFGVALHPHFCGWFAIRGVIIIKNLILENEFIMKQPDPLQILVDEKEINYLLQEFSTNWKQHLWRDVIKSTTGKKYSNAFRNYLETEPTNRWEYLKEKGLINL